MRFLWYRRSGGNWPLLPVALLLFVAALSAHALPREAQPDVRLELADLGFPGVPQGFQDSGASMVTVHFVDNTHLLLTYSLRGLVERIPDDPPEDDDRAVAALLLELPSGKVLARTRWHLHDHGQYLWNAGSGRFLLRVRSTLMSIAPLANLASGDAFRQTPFAYVGGKLSAVLVSPEHDLVTVESDLKEAGKVEVSGDAPPDGRSSLELFSFLRVSGTGDPESPVHAVTAGQMKVEGIGGLPVNGRGYLLAESGKRDRWSMQFQGFDGQTRKLSDVDSSCPPQMQFVSPGQFVTVTCRGSNDNLVLSAFDFAPREMWEEPMSGALPFDEFAYAQEAGRFALSRVTSLSGATDPAGSGAVVLGLSAPAAQEFRVYQIESGDLIFKLTCSPAVRAGQNFDLSADGLNLVALRKGAIEEYHLPAPTAQDKKDLVQAKQYEPPATSGSVQWHMPRTEQPAVTSAVSAGSSTSASANAAATAPANAGDAGTPRKPPSLLNPGETVEGKKAPEQ